MISKKTKYALKGLLYLARKYDQGPIMISDLARDERLPEKFLELILLSLKNNCVLQSKKGKGGGYYLGKPPKGNQCGTCHQDPRRAFGSGTLRERLYLCQMPRMSG